MDEDEFGTALRIAFRVEPRLSEVASEIILYGSNVLVALICTRLERSTRIFEPPSWLSGSWLKRASGPILHH